MVQITPKIPDEDRARKLDVDDIEGLRPVVENINRTVNRLSVKLDGELINLLGLIRCYIFSN